MLKNVSYGNEINFSKIAKVFIETIENFPKLIKFI